MQAIREPRELTDMEGLRHRTFFYRGFFLYDAKNKLRNWGGIRPCETELTEEMISFFPALGYQRATREKNLGDLELTPGFAHFNSIEEQTRAIDAFWLDTLGD